MSNRNNNVEALIRALTEQVTALPGTVNNVAGEIQNTNANVHALAQQYATDITTLAALVLLLRLSLPFLQELPIQMI